MKVKRILYLGKVGQVIASVLEPLGFGKWEAGASLIAGLVAKEIVVGTMGEIYVQKQEDKKKEAPPFGRSERGGRVVCRCGKRFTRQRLFDLRHYQHIEGRIR